jgi:hypothetical protein
LISVARAYAKQVAHKLHRRASGEPIAIEIKRSGRRCSAIAPILAIFLR